MQSKLVTFEIANGEFTDNQYAIFTNMSDDWTDKEIITEVYGIDEDDTWDTENAFLEMANGNRIVKVYEVNDITDAEAKVLKKFHIAFDVWQNLHNPD